MANFVFISFNNNMNLKSLLKVSFLSGIFSLLVPSQKSSIVKEFDKSVVNMGLVIKKDGTIVNNIQPCVPLKKSLKQDSISTNNSYKMCYFNPVKKL